MSLEDIIYEPEVIVLGVFGNTNKVSEKELQENTLTLILQELGRTPDKVLVPSEGNSSIYIQEWADSLKIKTQVFQADWIRNGRAAAIFRDERMTKECTHALVFLPAPRAGKQSNRLEKNAEKMAKKGKTVFTSSHNQTLTQLELSHLEPSQTVRKASGHARKSDKGITQMWQKYQKTTEY